MLIGNPSTFAVEYELNENYEGVWLLGKFCYWIQNEQIGDYNLGTSLRDILFQIESIVRFNNKREGKRFAHISSQEVFTLLNAALYGIDDSLTAMDEQWARYDVCPLIDVFNNWKVYLVENSAQTRIIYQNVLRQEISEIILEPNQFEIVIRKSYEAINEMYETELTLNN